MAIGCWASIEEAAMRRRVLQVALALSAALLTALPEPVAAGGLYFTGYPCWCQTSIPESTWVEIYVLWLPGDLSECQQPTNAAFRIDGMPSAPAVSRSFVSWWSTMTGDPFGEGARFDDLAGGPGEYPVGFIRLFANETLPAQQWSLRAHLGIAGTTTPVVEFRDAPGIWRPAPEASVGVNSGVPCQSCIPPPYQYCPFEVEPATWVKVKRLYD